MTEMKNKINVLLSLIKINFANLLIYRTNFIISFIDEATWFAISVFFYKYIYISAYGIHGVSLRYLLILVSFSEIIKSILFSLCISNLPYFPRMVRNGSLDNILMKPIDSQFFVSFRKFDFGNILNVMPPIIIITYYNLIDIKYLPIIILLVFVSILTCYSLWFIVTTSAIWFINIDDIHELFFGILSLNQFPSIVFKKTSNAVFLILLPILCSTNIPAEYVIKQNHIFYKIILFIIISIVLFIISRFFWKFSIRHYVSVN